MFINKIAFKDIGLCCKNIVQAVHFKIKIKKHFAICWFFITCLLKIQGFILPIPKRISLFSFLKLNSFNHQNPAI